MHKKQLILDYWRTNFACFDWDPEIYRVLIHFDPEGIEYGYLKRYEPESYMVYQDIDQEMVERVQLRKGSFRKSERILLNQLSKRNDQDLMRTLIFDENEKYSFLRGRLTEAFVEDDVWASKPEDIIYLPEQFIAYQNQRYISGTEVDGLMVFHDRESYRQFLFNMSKNPHLRVYRRNSLQDRIDLKAA